VLTVYEGKSVVGRIDIIQTRAYLELCVDQLTRVIRASLVKLIVRSRAVKIYIAKETLLHWKLEFL
jgi:hypothetical protein